MLCKAFFLHDSSFVHVVPQFRGLLTITFALNYVAILATVVLMLLAGFRRSVADSVVEIYAIVVVITLLVSFLRGYNAAARLQDERMIKFYQKYCDVSGELKDEYLKVINDKRNGTRKEDEKDQGEGEGTFSTSVTAGLHAMHKS